VEDTDRTWMVSGEDPWSTYRYAGAAANLARNHSARTRRTGTGARESRRNCNAWAQQPPAPRRGADRRTPPQLRPMRREPVALTGRSELQATRSRRTTKGIEPVEVIWPIWQLHGRGRHHARPGRRKETPDHAQTHHRRRCDAPADEEADRHTTKRARLLWGRGTSAMPMLVWSQTGNAARAPTAPVA